MLTARLRIFVYRLGDYNQRRVAEEEIPQFPAPPSKRFRGSDGIQSIYGIGPFSKIYVASLSMLALAAILMLDHASSRVGQRFITPEVLYGIIEQA